MTIRSGITRTVLLFLLAVMTALEVRSQEAGTLIFREDSVRSARMDSIYRSLNDTATWAREMEFVRNLQFEEKNDSDLIKQAEQDIRSEKGAVDELPAFQRQRFDIIAVEHYLRTILGLDNQRLLTRSVDIYGIALIILMVVTHRSGIIERRVPIIRSVELKLVRERLAATVEKR